MNKVLFLINILHQTATVRRAGINTELLFLINILHQTATSICHKKSNCRQYSTSNRNYLLLVQLVNVLFLINILHQTATTRQS